MYLAHIVPGYFAAATTTRQGWTPLQKAALWTVALVSTVAPDSDVIYNALFRGYVNHSVLWTHSVFVPLVLIACWGILRVFGRGRFVRMLFLLAALGWASHLVLDVIAHGTPLLYPYSRRMFGTPSPRVMYGGIREYVTDPVFLLEPVLITTAVVHWLLTFRRSSRHRALFAAFTVASCAGFIVLFLMFLPNLQNAVAR